MGYIIFALFLVGLYLFGMAYETIKNHKDVDDVTFYISMAVIIVFPVLLFTFIIPNIKVQGYHSEYSTIKSSTNKTYNVMVDYYIHEEGNTPEIIRWSNGGHCDNQRDDYGLEGDIVNFIDQEGKEFEVTIPKMNFTFSEQFKTLSWVDKLCYCFIFLSAIINIICKIKDSKKNQHKNYDKQIY